MTIIRQMKPLSTIRDNRSKYNICKDYYTILNKTKLKVLKEIFNQNVI